MLVEKLNKVGGNLVMEGFVGKEKNSGLNSWDKEQVEVLKDRSDGSECQ